MAVLIVFQNGKQVQSVALEEGKQYIAGRADTCDILLKSSAVSRQHFKVFFDGANWQVEVLSQYAQMSHLGGLSGPQPLGDGSTFTVDDFEIRFSDTEGDISRTLDLRASEAKNQSEIEGSDKTEKADWVQTSQESYNAVLSGSNSSLKDFGPVSRSTGNSGTNSTSSNGDLPSPDNSENHKEPFPVGFEASQNTSKTGSDEMIPPDPVQDQPGGTFVRTDLHPSVGTAYVTIMNQAGEKKVLKLTGSRWRAGRSKECEIKLRSQHFSRIHFQIMKAGAQYSVTDLESSNGTRLNGSLLPSNKSWPLQSGDMIQVRGTKILFEVRDESFQQRLQEIPTSLRNPPALKFSSGDQYLADRGTRGAVPLRRSGGRGRRPGGPNQIIVGLIIIGIIYLLLGDRKRDSNEDDFGSQDQVIQDSDRTPYEKLTDDQKLLVEDTYQRAKEFYIQGRYETSFLEFKKLHRLISYFKDSKEIQTYCQQAIDIRTEQIEIIEKQREQEEIRRRVSQIIELCELKFEIKKSLTLMEKCLDPAILWDPDNPRAQRLIDKAQRAENRRATAARRRRQAKANSRKVMSLLSQAEKKMKDEKYLEARNLLKKLLKLGDPGQKREARAKIAQLSSAIIQKAGDLGKQAQGFRDKEDYKRAIASVQKAREYDPKNNNFKDLEGKIQGELYRKVKTIYQDSVLEENLGNIEAAKLKWKKIMEMDLKSGEYAGKARRKLQKYGE